MRALIANLIVFFAVIEGLKRVEFTTLLVILGAVIVGIVCIDILFRNLFSRAQ